MIDNVVFTREDLERLWSGKKEGQKRLAERLLEKARKVLEDQEQEWRGGGSIMLLGFGYHTTGEEAYFEAARRRMLKLAALPDWCPDEREWKGSDLITGAKCEEMAYGYSLFGDKLIEEERKLVVKATYEKGIRRTLEDWLLPGTKLHVFDTMGHNWWPVCVSHAALALVVMMGDKESIPDGEELCRAVCEGLEAWTAYPGNPLNAKPASFDNGSFYESVNYFNYTMWEYLSFANAYLRKKGKHPFDDEALLAQAALFYANTFYPAEQKGYTVGFGDTGGHFFWQGPVGMVRYGIDVPELRWYLQSAVSRDEEHEGDTELMFRALSYEAIYERPARPPENLSAAWLKNGWAVFRSSFEKNADMLAVKCGDTWNHAHADAAHFILYRQGKPQIYDSLTVDYDDKLYIGYYVESVAHNVLLFNGKGQDVRDNYKNHARMRGQLYHYVDEDGFRYIAADGTGPMSRYFRKHFRHFLWLGGFILIYDDVECYEEGEVSFLLHAGEKHPFRMLSQCSITEHEGYVGHDKKPVVYQAYRQRTDGEGHVKFLSVLLLEEELDVTVTELDAACRVTCGDTNVYINYRSDGKIMHRNCTNTMDGVLTDAAILVEKQGRYGVVNGAIVRKGNVSYLDRLARTDGWCDKR